MNDRFSRWFTPDDYTRREIDEEITSHLEARREHLMRQGMSEEAARAEALRRFGDLDKAREGLLARARAHRRRLAWRDRLEQIRGDFSFVIRSLLRSPAFTAGVVTTLALALGINTAVFRVVDQILFRPPAGVEDARAIRRVEAQVSIGGAAPQRATVFSYPDAVRILDANVFAPGSAYVPPRTQVDGQGRELGVSYVDGRYFEMLGVRPVRGRFFDATEVRPGTSPRLAVVSMNYWINALDRRVIDDALTITLGSHTYRVIGVTPRGFVGIEPDPAVIWLPFGDGEFGRGSINGVEFPWYRAEMLRLLRIAGRPAARDDEAQQRLTAALGATGGQFTATGRAGRLVPIVPVQDSARAESVNAMLLRLAVVAVVVLVIGSANVINLLLARGLRRSREIAIRYAVGASRWRVARLLLAESLVLAAAGGIAAIISGLWTAEALRRLVFPDARWTADTFDQRTVFFTAGAAVLAGLAAGIVPAVQSVRQGLTISLKEVRAPGTRGRRMRAALIVVQTALSLVLLVGCGLLVSSLSRLHAVDPGFEPSGLVSWSVGRSDLPESRIVELSERLQQLPDVKGTALASIAAFGATAMIDITVPGSTFVPESSSDNPLFMAVTPEFFGVMGMRVVLGRGFTAADGAGADPVALVNEVMARRYWGTADPRESCILAPPHPCARVIGIVTSVTDNPGGAPPPGRFYIPLAQSSRGPGAFIVRVGPESVPAVAAALRSMTESVRPPTIDVVSDRIGRALHPWWTATLLFSAMGAIALALAGVGIYSVTSYLVAERLHEMGVRLALGAERSDVLAIVLGRGVRLVGVGITLGLLAAAGCAHLLESLLYQVSAREPLIYGTAALTLLMLGTAATLPAAVRAASVDPVETLRTE